MGLLRQLIFIEIAEWFHLENQIIQERELNLSFVSPCLSYLLDGIHQADNWDG